MYKLYKGDCLELLKDIPDKSIDLVLTDPPYNIKKAKWDNIPDYINWCRKWILECQRVLKDNGTLYFFHNDMVQIAQLMEFIRLNTDFKFNSFCIWDKGDFRALSWKHPSEKNNLRCWFNTCEYCLVFVKMQGYKTTWDRTGWDSIKLDVNNFQSLRQYAYKVLCYIGGGEPVSLNYIKTIIGNRKAEHFFYCLPKEYPNSPKSQVMKEIGGKADHFTRYGSTRWELCTPETYQELIDKFNIDKMIGFKEYEELRQEYEELRFTHNLDDNHKNIWYSDEPRNDGKIHPTQKPIDILERIIRVSSNEGATVLDPFLGSGSTGVACANTGRKFIGMELDNNYFNVAESRISEAFFNAKNN